MEQEQKKDGLLENSVDNKMESDVFGQSFSMPEIKAGDNYVPDPSMNNMATSSTEFEQIENLNPFATDINKVSPILNDTNTQAESNNSFSEMVNGVEAQNLEVEPVGSAELGTPILEDNNQNNFNAEMNFQPEINNPFGEMTNNVETQNLEVKPVGSAELETPILEDNNQNNFNAEMNFQPETNNQFGEVENSVGPQNLEVEPVGGVELGTPTLENSNQSEINDDNVSDAEIKKFFKDFIIIAIIVIIIIILLPYASNFIGL